MFTWVKDERLKSGFDPETALDGFNRAGGRAPLQS
jgi:hypothetical protein